MSAAAAARPSLRTTADPNRRWSRSIAGATATTSRYRPRNQSGWTTSLATGRRTASGTPASPRAAAPPAHTARKARVGRSSLAARSRTNPDQPSPRRAETRLARPPTKKNSGITWSSQVASHRPGTRVSALPPSTRPSRQATTAISQCPATTTRMLATRSRSANRSRSAGVAAATRLATALASIGIAGLAGVDGIRTGPAWPGRAPPGIGVRAQSAGRRCPDRAGHLRQSGRHRSCLRRVHGRLLG
jgi:hypothetical protein